MKKIVDRINEDYLFAGGLFNPEQANHDAVRDLIRDCRDEILRLEKYEQLVHFIANDYWELSHDKIKWIYTDYKKRCRKLIEEDHEQESKTTPNMEE